ncbi:organic cation transporter -like [Brachionus plicatilis]|uniref:Organic cation transporter-like n=1 Tax=Brachionus plicatilis TaxID=10195 RepID=A0A3M7PXA2_BRAPC|nr:organic cation transporter -like [Brachionus plicatilis]
MRSLRHENIYEDIGEIGPYQIFLFSLVGLLAAVPALTGYGFVFIGATPDYRCKIPIAEHDTFNLKDQSHYDSLVEYIPRTRDKIFNKCNIRQNSTDTSEFVPCTEWVYSTEFYDTTMVTEWNLVCSNFHYKSLYMNLHFIGTCGVVLSGILSDRFGRKKIAYILLSLNALVAVLSAILLNTNTFDLAVKRNLFAVLKLLYAITSNVYSIAITLVIELTGPNRRILASNFVAISFVMVSIVLSSVAFFLRNFQMLSIFIACVTCLIPTYFWIVPESPRWLILQKRKTEALRILGKISKSNKKPMNFVEEIESLQNSAVSLYRTSDEKLEFLELVKFFMKKRLYVFRTFILVINWTVISAIYYGISFFTEKIPGDPYLNCILFILVDLVALIFIQMTTERFGRKVPFTVAMTIGGITFILMTFLPSHSVLSTFCALIGKLCIAFALNLSFTITSEFYPTFIRNSVTSLLVGIGRGGSVSSTYIHRFGELYKLYNLPFFIFGASSLFAGLLFFTFMPETKEKTLPENLDEF